jgi:hypothetical protein
MLRKAGLFATPLALAALAIPVAGQATDHRPGAEVKRDTNPNRQFYAVDSAGNLVWFSARAPRAAMQHPITGLPSGVSLVGIDTRPATGDLYGIGSDSVVYRINPSTAIAVAEGLSFTPSLRGRYFGVDFNPTVDRIRLTSDFDQNLRLHPDDGNVVGNDADLNPGEPTVVGSAYTNSSFGVMRPAATVLYALDAGDDTLCVQSPPNAGTLTACKELQVNVRGDAGFDIAGPDTDNVGYLATRAPRGSGSALWRIDLATGGTVRLGRIGDGSSIVTCLAAVQDLRP